MKRHWKWLVAGLLLVVAVGIALRLAGARKTEVAQPPVPQKAQSVVELAASDVVKAEVRELQRGLPINGSLKAVNSAFVKARIAGELMGLTVREGDTVQAGQVVARVEATEVVAKLKQAQEQADAAQAQIDIARRQWVNNKALMDQGFISKASLDTSENTLTGAQATHKAALAAIDMAKKSVDDAVLRAPITGTVAQRLAQPGERVGIDAKVIEIVDLSRLELEATLTAADSVDVRVGQAATLQVEGSPKALAAKVVRINPSAQAGSRGVLAYLSVADTAGLRQGLFAQGTLATGEVKSLAVPLAAVRTDKPSPYVQVVEADKVVHRPVRPGARGDAGKENWVAVEGLAAGATVIHGHVGALREGSLVKFTGTTPAPLPAASRP